MNKNYEFITAKDYVKEFKTTETDVISAVEYYEQLKKELLPNEFAY